MSKYIHSFAAFGLNSLAAVALVSILIGLGTGQGASTTPTATATPSTLAFSYQIGAAKLPASQTVSLKTSASGASFNQTVTGGNAPWLTVTPDTGVTPATLTLTVNPTSLSAGTYTASVAISVNGIGNPLAVAVTLVITAPPSTLTVNPQTLAFTAPPSPVAPQTFIVSTQTAPLAFTVAAQSPWIAVSPAVGVVTPGENLGVTVTVDPTSLKPQTAPYSGNVTITAGGKVQTVTVSLTLASSTPFISSVFPAALAANAGPQTVTLRGQNFYSATVVKIQGQAGTLAPTVLGPTALLVALPAALAPGNLVLVVSNPPPGGDSGPVSIPVVSTSTIAALGNVASYESDQFSPGELVTIFGTNLGPTTPVGMNVTGGFVNTTLGGVTVTVDSVPAPLLYVSQSQITIQVPYEVTQGSGKFVTVTNGSNATAATTVTIGPAVPGIFSADGSGQGQAAALNFDATTGYTLNGAKTPVLMGDTIILYLTGEGDYNQTLVPRTGLIIPTTMNPLPTVVPPPTVTIGGQAAVVNYAGPVVGSILGVLQVNAVVPAGLTAGPAVPIALSFNGQPTQTGVTIAVHP